MSVLAVHTGAGVYSLSVIGNQMFEIGLTIAVLILATVFTV